MLFTARREHHQPDQWLKELYSCLVYLIHISCILYSYFLSSGQKGRSTKRDKNLWKASYPDIAYTQRKVFLWKESSLCYCLDALVFAQCLSSTSSPCTATESTMGSSNQVGLLEVALSFLHVFGPMALLQESRCLELPIAFSIATAYVKIGNESTGANVLQHKLLLLSFSKQN